MSEAEPFFGLSPIHVLMSVVGATVFVAYLLPRFALSGGKNLLVGGMATGSDPDELLLTLWG